MRSTTNDTLSTAAPMISVCITSYNHQRFIAQCLRSVVEQDFQGGLEVLVGDDGSSDDTRNIISALAESSGGVIRPFFNHSNMGPSENLKNLVAQARGDFIAHLDGDDYWLAGKLQAQLKRLQASVRCVAVYANAIVIGENDAELGLFNSEVPEQFGTDYLLERGNFLHHGSLLYRAAERDVVTGIEGNFVDYRIHLRLASRGALAYIDRPLSVYRWRTNTSMIGTMSSAVHMGYWQALCEAEAMGASSKLIDQAVGLFWQKLFIEAAINHSWRYLRSWWSRLLEQRPSFTSARLAALAVIAPIPSLLRWRSRMRPGTIFFAR